MDVAAFQFVKTISQVLSLSTSCASQPFITVCQYVNKGCCLFPHCKGGLTVEATLANLHVSMSFSCDVLAPHEQMAGDCSCFVYGLDALGLPSG